MINRAWLRAASCGALSALVVAACTVEHPVSPGLMSFAVSFAAGGEAPDTGTEEDPLEYVAGAPCSKDSQCPEGERCSETGQCSMELRFDVVAMGRDGEPFNYRGPVHIRVTPGEVANQSEVFLMEGGEAENVVVNLVRGVGPTHVWFEQDGFQPLEWAGEEVLYGQCSDGIDNDANGLVDQADPGCDGTDDDLEAPVNGSAGLSETLHFHDPTIRDVQQSASLVESPLQGRQAEISSGTLVVTNVVANGFYVVDLGANDEEVNYSGLFVFTFSKPQGIHYGDVICSVSGAVDEHVGHTQLTFPSFERYFPGNELCEGVEGLDPDAQIPDPWELTSRLDVEDPKASSYEAVVYENSLLLERFEANLVTFTDVEVSTRFIACDRNGNGIIELGDERDCRNDCQEDPLCTDLEGYFQFSQYGGRTAGRKVIYGSTALADDFKPLDIPFIGAADDNGACELAETDDGFSEYTCPPTTLESLTGSLRHIYLCGEDWEEAECDLQFWVVDPRFDGDVVVAE